jgi:hypothetical protein
MSRFLSHLAELQPELFAEISSELAATLKIDNGDHISIVTLRGAIEARALVSRRMRPMHLNGKTVHQIAMPFHFGSAGPVRGDSTNDLVPISGEPNVTIMEAKALACNIVPGRLPRGPAFEDWIKKHVPVDGPPNLHPEQPPPGAPRGGKLAAGHEHEIIGENALHRRCIVDLHRGLVLGVEGGDGFRVVLRRCMRDRCAGHHEGSRGQSGKG